VADTRRQVRYFLNKLADQAASLISEFSVDRGDVLEVAADALDRSYAFIGEHVDRNALPINPQNLDC
jgi:hypothetical protein